MEYVESASDKKIVARWLKAFIALGCTHAAVFYLLLGLLDGEGYGSLVGISIWTAATYWFSYKKRGTKWALWTLVAFGATTLTEGFSMLKSAEDCSMLQTLVLGYIGLRVYFWLCMLWLYGANCRYQEGTSSCQLSV